MYYLLRLEVVEKIERGTEVVDFGDDPFPLTKRGEVSLEHSGLLWDGERFGRLSDKYQEGDLIAHDVFDICFSYLAIDERGLSDEVWEDLPDLLECDLMEQWQDIDKPIVFLMSLTYEKHDTEIGPEFDSTHHSVKVVTHDDFARLDKDETRK